MKTKINYESLVTDVLEEFEEARSSDKFLYGVCCNRLGFDMTIPLREYLLSNDFPSYDSISRARRKVQSKRADLVNEKTKANRAVLENEYYNYYTK